MEFPRPQDRQRSALYKMRASRRDLTEVDSKGVITLKPIFTRVLVVVLPLSLFAANGVSDDKPAQQRRDISVFMQQKLKHSQRLLEWLAIEDYDSLADSADALKKIGNDAQWKVT